MTVEVLGADPRRFAQMAAGKALFRPRGADGGAERESSFAEGEKAADRRSDNAAFMTWRPFYGQSSPR